MEGFHAEGIVLVVQGGDGPADQGDGGFVELAHGGGQTLPIVVGEAPSTQVLHVDAPERGEEARGELGAGHLHGENGHRQALMDGDVFGNVERKRRLPHRGATGENDEIGGLQTRGLFVEIDVAGGNAGDLAGVGSVVEFLDAVDDELERLPDGDEAGETAGAGFGDLEDLGFGFVEQGLGFAPMGLRAEAAISSATAMSLRRMARSRMISP